MASHDDHSSNSPMHLGLTGHFSPEDIQELLGVMGDGSDTHHHQGEDRETPANSDGFAHLTDTTDRDSTASVATASVPAAANNQSSNSGNQGSTNGCANQSSSPPDEEAKAQARSERKRSREKQRRSDVNKQFADLTHLLQRIDAENINEEDVKNGTTNHMAFNPSNRVDLVARTIVLLERLHEANKRRRTEISSLQQQLEEAKKAGEDTAAKLKEAMLAPPGQPASKQFMMMVPMMMSSDGTGAPVPMMNPYMPQAHMPQAFCPMPAHAMAPAVAHASQPAPAAAAPAQSHATAPPAAPMAAAAPPAVAAAPHAQQPQQHMQQQAFPYMMPPHMAGGGFMMPMPAPGHHVMAGQPMQPRAVQHGTTQESQNGQQEQKDSSNDLNGGSNLAHCA